MSQVIGKDQKSIQIQIKNKKKSLSFTVKNITINDAYSKALFLFKSVCNENSDVTLKIYNTKDKQETEE